MKRLDVRAFYMRTSINGIKRKCIKSQQTKGRCVIPELTLSVFMYFSRIALLWSASTRATSFLRFTIVTIYRPRRRRTIEIRKKSSLFDTEIKKLTIPTYSCLRSYHSRDRVCYLVFKVIFTGGT